MLILLALLRHILVTFPLACSVSAARCDTHISGEDVILTTDNDLCTHGDVLQILEVSLSDSDPCQCTCLETLRRQGISSRQALCLWAGHRSSRKYGFRIPDETLGLVYELLAGAEFSLFLKYPFAYLKACWIFEHAPAFLGCSVDDSVSRKEVVLNFARDYRDHFLRASFPRHEWQERTRKCVGQVLKTTFWERDAFSPIQLLEQVWHDGLLGLELGIDFHPFNVTKLLPEEFSPRLRDELRAAITDSGLVVDIHSPIIGPYIPVPNPAAGKQAFYDPSKCRDIQAEVLDLAMDIGARDVVFHLVSAECTDFWVQMVERVTGSRTRVTMENYYQTKGFIQSSAAFLEVAERVRRCLTPEQIEHHFGVTVDVGHLNIEGDDPLGGAIAIGKWCRDHGVYLRMHATDNYGLLLFSPPAFSADVHGNVSGRGINNGLIIRALRSLGHHPTVVAEQIRPLIPEDIETIDQALTDRIDEGFEAIVSRGSQRLATSVLPGFLQRADASNDAHCFIAGLYDLEALQEYIVYRTIQDNKHLSVDEAMRISREFMSMPSALKQELTAYIDDLLLPVQTETGFVQKSQLDLICQNINGAIFWSISNENMARIFSETREYAAGTVICEQHRPGREMYFVKAGEVEVFIDGHRAALLQAGEIFGEISLFYNIPRSATIQATRDHTVLGILTRHGLEQLFRSQETFVCDLITRLYKVLPGRLRNMNEKYRAAIRTLNMLSERDDEATALETAGDDGLVEVQGTDVLPMLSREDARDIFPVMRSYERGATICREGDVADGVYFLDRGCLGVSVLGDHGERLDIAKLEAGEVFGEISLIEGLPRSATVHVVEDSEVAFLPRDQFQAFIESGSPPAFRFMGYVCLLLFRRILRLDHIYSRLKRQIAILEK